MTPVWRETAERPRSRAAQWIVMLGALLLCTWAVYHAFPAGESRAALTDDVSKSTPGSAQHGSRDLG
ncbi:hypothetical protein [Microvirga pudoricolor]|uniref:hypothetical protein n=1 Tax=Microvirga pudoricolor TaxID=2778729 RepID=UPI00194FB4B3|nr:hypothetical protein [Microvirga pudoricolor]MBM6595694.1 hypothetical protein [Microvirga pudoricolor]